MATLIQVRGLRRAAFRVNNLPVSAKATVTFDVDDPKTRQELQHHLAIGQAVVVGDRLPANTAVTVVDKIGDCIVLPTKSNTVRGLDVSKGTLRLAGNTTQAVAAQTIAYGAPDATLPRVDIVQIADATGVATVKAGTARATGPAAPSPDVSNTVVAEVFVPSTASGRKVGIRDVRPLNP